MLAEWRKRPYNLQRLVALRSPGRNIRETTGTSGERCLLTTSRQLTPAPPTSRCTHWSPTRVRRQAVYRKNQTLKYEYAVYQVVLHFFGVHRDGILREHAITDVPGCDPTSSIMHSNQDPGSTVGSSRRHCNTSSGAWMHYNTTSRQRKRDSQLRMVKDEQTPEALH